MTDPVNHPSHYTSGSVECIDAIEAALTPEEFRGYLRGCSIKYQWRCGKKDDAVQDLKKSIWYAEKLASVMKPKPKKPLIPNPPEGYRLKQDGDKKDRNSMVWVEQESAWRLVNHQLPTWDASRIYAVPVQSEKRYRAFASFEEWWPHRERWVRTNGGSVFKTGWAGPATAKADFGSGAVFLNDDGSDGEPFGVEMSE